VDKTTKKLIDMVAGDPALSQEFRTALARPELPVDPVSGLWPRFMPLTPLPPGAVLVYVQWAADTHWIPDGTFGYVYADGSFLPNASLYDMGDITAAARALSLPLREPGGMEEGEEAISDARLIAEHLKQEYPSTVDPRDWTSHAIGMHLHFGLDNLRRWGNAAHGGWICRRIAKPAEKSAEEAKRRNVDYWQGYADGQSGVLPCDRATQSGEIARLANNLSTRDARIEEPENIIEHNRRVCADCEEVKRLRGEIAAIEGHLTAGHYTLVDQWLTRNGGA
jgi:hypothetical protein